MWFSVFLRVIKEARQHLHAHECACESVWTCESAWSACVLVCVRARAPKHNHARKPLCYSLIAAAPAPTPPIPPLLVRCGGARRRSCRRTCCPQPIFSVASAVIVRCARSLHSECL